MIQAVTGWAVLCYATLCGGYVIRPHTMLYRPYALQCYAVLPAPWRPLRCARSVRKFLRRVELDDTCHANHRPKHHRSAGIGGGSGVSKDAKLEKERMGAQGSTGDRQYISSHQSAYTPFSGKKCAYAGRCVKQSGFTFDYNTRQHDHGHHHAYCHSNGLGWAVRSTHCLQGRA